MSLRAELADLVVVHVPDVIPLPAPLADPEVSRHGEGLLLGGGEAL
jgi:hypothetical protein